MSSRKRSAKARQRAEFEASAADLTDLFENEARRTEEASRKRDAFLVFKSCESKNRYGSRAEAAEARRMCETHGTYGLNIYHCDHCGGWHLTSKHYED